jgi:signal transduction histidine kinase
MGSMGSMGSVGVWEYGSMGGGGVMEQQNERKDSGMATTQKDLAAQAEVTDAADQRPTIRWLSDADSYRVLENLLLEPGSPDEVCQRIVALAEQDTRVATCSIFLIDQTGENLLLAATNNGALKSYLSQPTYRLGEGITGWVAKYREPALVRDPRDPDDMARLADPARGLPAPTPGAVPFSEGARDGWLAAPITDIDKQDCIGVIRVQPRVPWLELTKTDLNRLQVVARLTYLVAQNAHVREEQREEAQEEALRTVTATVAHRVGNQLYALRNLIEALHLSLERGGPNSIALLDRMRETLEVARNLVRNLVKQASLPPLNPRPCALPELLRMTAGSCVPCNLVPEVSVAPDAETIICDPDQLRTALGEIVQNCVEIVGCDVRVSVEATTDRGWTSISISDNGPGVDDDMKHRIFEPLFSTRPGGTGWGLVIAREIVEKHGGSIAEEGVPGQGARFVIRLPKGRADALSPAGR